MKAANDLPEERRLYQYEVELIEIGTGASRRVPLECVHRIPLPTKKAPEVGEPFDVLRFKDGEFEIEARTFDEFRERLRVEYPDERFERRLHAWQDREAEERRERAMEGLMQIIVHAAVERLVAEQSADGSKV